MQTRQYGDYQFDIYLDGLQGKLPRYPVDFSVAGACGGRGAALMGALLRRRRRWRRKHPARQRRSLLAIRDRASDARGRDRTRPVGVTV